MAYYFLFPESDTTMYSHPDRSEMNTGKDEILELVKERGSTDKKLYPSRILIKFKNEEIQSIITDSITPSVFNNGISKVNLQLTSTEPKNLTSTLNVVAYAVSQSWNEGTGRFLNLPTSSNGATWNYRDNSIAKTKWTTSSFASATTGSLMSASVLTPGGGVWYTGSGFYAPQQFLTGDNLDLDFDVTSIIQKHSASLFANSTYPTGIINNGFIIRKPDDVENHISTSFGDLQYFSVDTHTIYPPKLVFKWIDSVHNFQGESKQSGELNVSLYRNKKEFNQNDVATFRINVRDKYPTRTFTTSSNYLNAGYFTTSSFYSIRDAHTEQEVIPFDTTFTKLSADSEGMYFKIYMKGLQPERYYRLLFKHINNDGTMVYDNDYNFKVVR
tara:strand:+ start:146 stop:1303 length:1158 start_codon:yes stop_codon:yes gene_type:complete